MVPIILGVRHEELFAFLYSTCSVNNIIFSELAVILLGMAIVVIDVAKARMI
jgi:hypothetical protein